MKKTPIIILLLALLLAPATLAAEDFSPTVDITCAEYVAIGGELAIAVEVSQTYIENSTFEISMESAPGWGLEEQSYFLIVNGSESIAALADDEELSFELLLTVLATAPEKQYSIPLVFYGKAGECADGCVPFRLEYSVTVTTVDTQSASQKIVQAQDAYGNEEYSVAKRLYTDAQAIYVLLGDDGSAGLLDSAIADAQTGVEALQLYESGMSKFTVGNRQAAKQIFTESRQLFSDIGNSARVSELDGLIAQCQEATPTPPPAAEEGESYAVYYAIAGVAVVAIATLLALMWKK